MEKKPYLVTEKAGRFVAGQRRPPDGVPLMLTDVQAFAELRFGNIIPAPEKPAPKAKAKA